MDKQHAGAMPHDESQQQTLWDGASVPILRINVFGRFEVRYGDEVVSSSNARSRRLKTLMGILALNHGRELYCDYLAESFWPNSPAQKQRNCFYNLWYQMMRTVPEGADKTLYFARQQYSCRLLDDYVSSDVADAERACDDLCVADLDPVQAVDAYRRLQRSYCGDLLPGEYANGIVLRSRAEWREKVVDSLFSAAKQLRAKGEPSIALWMVEAASRVDGMREDLVRLRMRLLIDLGRPSAALRVYDDMRLNLMHEVGTGPSAQSSQLVKELVDAIPIEYQSPIMRTSRRRGRPSAARIALQPQGQKVPARR